MLLWGTDNIKTYGESLAQVLWMIGVEPVADTFGRVNRVEPVSLEELGRPRIDVVVNCSGVEENRGCVDPKMIHLGGFT